WRARWRRWKESGWHAPGAAADVRSWWRRAARGGRAPVSCGLKEQARFFGAHRLNTSDEYSAVDERHSSIATPAAVSTGPGFLADPVEEHPHLRPRGVARRVHEEMGLHLQAHLVAEHGLQPAAGDVRLSQAGALQRHAQRLDGRVQ